MKIYQDVLGKFPKILKEIILKNETLSEDKFWKTCHDEWQEYEEIETPRSQARANDITKIFKLLGIHPTFETTYLDIGCGSGSITKLIAKDLGITNYHGLDILRPFDKDQLNYLGKRLIYYDGKNYPSVTADFVTCFQVLHHVKDIESMIKFINSTKCKYLIIREHDVRTEEEKKKIDFEHFIYGKIMQENVYNDFDESYYSCYRSVGQWIRLFKKFECKMVMKKKYTVDRIVYIVFKRL